MAINNNVNTPAPTNPRIPVEKRGDVLVFEPIALLGLRKKGKFGYNGVPQANGSSANSEVQVT
ncbi:MAG: hypothetical protein GY819_09075 [Planctomycetaceae bacterium]|nr:hypothetical protein [Planctomycetaceae bacterium]